MSSFSPGKVTVVGTVTVVESSGRVTVVGTVTVTTSSGRVTVEAEPVTVMVEPSPGTVMVEPSPGTVMVVAPPETVTIEVPPGRVMTDPSPVTVRVLIAPGSVTPGSVTVVVCVIDRVTVEAEIVTVRAEQVGAGWTEDLLLAGRVETFELSVVRTEEGAGLPSHDPYAF